MRVYAIGDIHGRLDLLEDCLAQIDEDIAGHRWLNPLQVFLGDYIDRGAYACETIDRLIARGQSHDCVFLRGNHELVAMQSLMDVTVFARWLRLGGAETLISYGIEPVIGTDRQHLVRAQMALQERLPPAHFTFFAGLRSHFACGDFYFVHAGIRPEIALDEQKEEDLLWIREPFLSSVADFGKVVVHGHTPTPQVDAHCNRVNIDTGAYASGRLSCLAIGGDDMLVMDTVHAPQ